MLESESATDGRSRVHSLIGRSRQELREKMYRGGEEGKLGKGRTGVWVDNDADWSGKMGREGELRLRQECTNGNSGPSNPILVASTSLFEA